MKKKFYIWIGTIFLIVIFVAVVAIKLYNKSHAEASQNNGDTKAMWNSEDGNNDNNRTNNDEDKLEKVVDTNPNSTTVLVNKEYTVAENYVPKDLVEPNIKFSFNYKDEKRKLRKVAADNLEILFQQAKSAGYELEGVSGYRSYKRQKTIYEYNLLKNGFEYTQIYSAMAGTSEHQTGLAIDISCPSMNGILTDKFGETKEGKWVAENSYKYGFIVRYPKNKSNITGYGYEPWHIRYVGTELAKYLYENNITLDEYYEYKLDSNIVDRSAYAYYDYLLTMESGGYKELSAAELDDVVDKNNVDISNSKPSKDNSSDDNNFDDNYDNNYSDDDNYVGDNDDNNNDDGGNTPDDPSDMFDNPVTESPTRKPEATKPPVATAKPETTKPPVATKEPEVDNGTTPDETESPAEG